LKPTQKLFDPIVSHDKQNLNFKRLLLHPACQPAKAMIENIFNEYKDVDGNFIEQFQSTGFHSRLWELFLFKCITVSGYKVIRSHVSPDYELKADGEEFFIEAVTSNPTDNDAVIENLIRIMETSRAKEEIDKAQSEIISHYVIKIASALYSKLQKEYWKLEWVGNKPLLLAIQAVHHKYATFFPDYKMITYLYGKEILSIQQEDKSIKYEYKNIEYHEYELSGKKIPSGFFNLPSCENISAVIFANTGDEKKYLRMGIQDGFSNGKVKAIRSGAVVNPNSELPNEFTYQVGDGSYTERWLDGVTVFHNPNARFPLSRASLKGSRHFWLENGVFQQSPQQFQILTSITGSFVIDNDKIYFKI